MNNLTALALAIGFTDAKLSPTHKLYGAKPASSRIAKPAVRLKEK